MEVLIAVGLWFFSAVDSLLHLAEFIYYIAFCGLTWLLYKYAKETYLFQTKKESQLFCKLCVPDSEHGKVQQFLYLEIYNSGNAVAKNIHIEYRGTELALLDFIKPNESYKLLIGSIEQMIGCNRIFIQGTEIFSTEVLVVVLSDDSLPERQYELNVSALFLHSDIVHNDEEEIVKELHSLNANIEKAFACRSVGPGHDSFRDELNHIAGEIAKKK